MMTSTASGSSIWTRIMTRLDLWVTAVDTDPYELAASRLDALEKRLTVVEAELFDARRADRDRA